MEGICCTYSDVNGNIKQQKYNIVVSTIRNYLGIDEKLAVD